MRKLIKIALSAFSLLTILTGSSFAETTMSAEGQYIFNSLAFYIGGVLVAFMAAGFCMLESGLVTTKSVSSIIYRRKYEKKIKLSDLRYFIIFLFR